MSDVLGKAGSMGPMMESNPQMAMVAGMMMFGHTLIKHLESTKPKAFTVTSSEPNPAWRMIYGKHRVAGVITWLGQVDQNVSGPWYLLDLGGSTNAYLFLVVTIAKGKLHAIDTVYFDNVAIPLDSLGNGTGVWQHKVIVNYDLGDPANSSQPFPNLVTYGPQTWKDPCLQRGHAKAYIVLASDSKLFPNGLPNISFDVRGREVYDPRTSATAYSTNPALCLRDYLTDQVMGLQCSSAEIDDPAFIAAANTCDETETLPGSVMSAIPTDISGHINNGGSRYDAGNIINIVGGNGDCACWVGMVSHTGAVKLLNVIDPGSGYGSGGNNYATSGGNGTGLLANITTDTSTEPLFSCNGLFESTETPQQVINNLCNAMGGYLAYSQGKFMPIVGAYATPSASLGDDDLRAPLEIQMRTSRRDLFNSASGTYLNEANNWQPSNYPAVSNPTYVTQDGVVLWHTLDLPFVTSATQAQRLASITINRNRYQVAVTARCKLTAAGIQPGDVIQLTHARLGWTDKTFFVQDTNLVIARDADLGSGDESPALGVDLVLHETAPDVFTWDASMGVPNTPAAGNPGTPVDVGPIESVAVTAQTAVGADGILCNYLQVNWTEINDQQVTDGGLVCCQYRLTNDGGSPPGTASPPVPGPWIAGPNVPGASTYLNIGPLSGATNYDVQVWPVNALGVSGEVVEVDDTETSTDVSQFSGTVYGMQVFVGAWSPSTQYYTGNEVTDAGSYWLCVHDNIGSEPSLVNSNWQLVGSGSTYMGLWDTDTDYQEGEIVLWPETGGYLYMAKVANQGHEPDTSPDYWAKQSGGIVWMGTYNPSLAYSEGSMVVYANTVWLCILDAPAGATPSMSSEYWQMVGSQSEYTGAWTDSPPTAYTEGQEVLSGGQVFICIQDNTSSSANEPPNTTYWLPLSGLIYVGPYASDYPGGYQKDMVVAYTDGNQYLCILNDPTNIAPPNATYWLKMGPANAQAIPGSQTYWGLWSPTQTYMVGQEVQWPATDSNFWLCTVDNCLDIEPGSGADTGQWVLVGPANAAALEGCQQYVGAFVPGDTYFKGQEVYYSYSVWLCNVATTTATPGTNSDWVLLGPSDISAVPNAQKYIGPFDPGHAYQAGNQVTWQAPGEDGTNYYLCTLATTAGDLPSDTGHWLLMGPSNINAVSGAQAFVGNWSQSVDYDPGNEVVYLDGNFYECEDANGPAETVYPPSYNYKGAYTSGNTYSPIDLVSSGGHYWLCLAQTTIAPASGAYWFETTPSPAPGGIGVTYSSAWQLMGPSQANGVPGAHVFLGEWSPQLDYCVGNEVWWTGQYWVCVANTAGQSDVVPGEPLVTVFWQLMSGQVNAPIGPWNSQYEYSPGDEVYYAPNLSGTGNVVSVGGSVTQTSRQNSWTNPSGAIETGSNWASVTLYGSSNQVNKSWLLNISGFNFSSVPSGATVTGIAVKATHYQSAGSSAAMPDTVTLLGLTGNVTDHTPTYPSGNLSGSYVTVTYGGSSDLWGVSPTLAQLQAGGFSVQLGYECTQGPGSGAVVQVQNVTVTVYYATSGVGTQNYYKCIAASFDNPPSSSPNYWTLVGPNSQDAIPDGQTYARVLGSALAAGVPYTYLGQWNSSAHYTVGEEVTWPATNPSYWCCAANNTNSAPALGNGNWTQMGSAPTFTGTYSAGTAYTVGQEASYNGVVWICTTACTGQTPSSASTYWEEVSAGYQGVYSASTTYQAGQTVSYGTPAVIYICILTALNQTPSTATSYWQPLSSGSFVGAWASGTSYYKDQEVSYTDGNMYWCKSSVANDTTAPSSDSTHWILVGPTNLDSVANGTTYSKVLAAYVTAGVPVTYKGSWASGKSYNVGDEVISGTAYYYCLLANTSSSGNQPPNGTYWQQTGTTVSVYLGTWASGVSYVAGNIVLLSSVIYTCILANTSSSGNQPPNATYWVSSTNSTDMGYWSGTASYVPGNQVAYQGAFFICTVANSNSAPYVGSSYWTLLGTSTIGIVAYSAGTKYNVGSECLGSDSNVYQCILATTGNAPPNASYWALVGPQTLDAVADGTTHIRGTQYPGSAIVLDNPNFLAGTAGWKVAGGGAGSDTMAVSTQSPITNGKSIELTTSYAYDAVAQIRQFKVSPGDTFFLSAWFKSDGVFQCIMTFSFYDGAGNSLGYISTGVSTSTSWTQVTGTGAAPANAASAMLYCLQRWDNSGGTHSGYCSQPHLVRVASLDTEVGDGPIYRRVIGVSGGLVQTGSVAPSAVSGSVYTSVTGYTSITSSGTVGSISGISIPTGFSYTKVTINGALASTNSTAIGWGATLYNAAGTALFSWAYQAFAADEVGTSKYKNFELSFVDTVGSTGYYWVITCNTGGTLSIIPLYAYVELFKR